MPTAACVGGTASLRHCPAVLGLAPLSVRPAPRSLLHGTQAAISVCVCVCVCVCVTKFRCVFANFDDRSLEVETEEIYNLTSIARYTQFLMLAFPKHVLVYIYLSVMSRIGWLHTIQPIYRPIIYHATRLTV